MGRDAARSVRLVCRTVFGFGPRGAARDAGVGLLRAGGVNRKVYPVGAGWLAGRVDGWAALRRMIALRAREARRGEVRWIDMSCT